MAQLTATEHRSRRAATRQRREYEPRRRMPVAALRLMAATGFITMMTEAMPVGLMPAMREDTGMSDGLIGQLVTMFAVGCGAAAIPMALLTRSWPRKPLLLGVLAAFVATNAATAMTTTLWIMMVSRFAAGVCAGLLWTILAGYAVRIVVPAKQGRAMAMAMAGTPLALCLGIPAGAYLGELLGWRMAFFVVSGCAAAVAIYGLKILPDVPGEQAGPDRRPVREVIMLPGLLGAVAVTMAFSVGHNTGYTFIAPLAETSGVSMTVGSLLLVFGGSAVIGLWLIGQTVDQHLRRLVLGVSTGLGLVMLGIAVWPSTPSLVLPVVVAWGLIFGGAPTLFQTLSARACGPSAEVGQALIVTTYNLSVAIAAAVGGGLVDAGQMSLIPVFGGALAVVCLVLIVRGSGGARSGQPRGLLTLET